MTDFEGVSSYPLTWPMGWKRTRSPRRSRFRDHSVAQATKVVLRQLEILRVRQSDVVISTNVELRLDGLPRSNRRAPEDSGAAVYFRRKGVPLVLACDTWNDVAANLWAIAKHIEALRGQERWGVGSLEQAFSGYAALPEPPAETWWRILGFESEVSIEDARRAFRALAKVHHPDAGGDSSAFARISGAWATAQEVLA